MILMIISLEQSTLQVEQFLFFSFLLFFYNMRKLNDMLRGLVELRTYEYKIEKETPSLLLQQKQRQEFKSCSLGSYIFAIECGYTLCWIILFHDRLPNQHLRRERNI